MTIDQQAKLKRFANDGGMASAVREVLLDTFTKERAKLDVQTLAAERIAINLLADAWRTIEGFKTDTNSSAGPVGQRAL